MLYFYPVNLNLNGKPVLVIAEPQSEVAKAKIEELELAGAEIRQISPADYSSASLKDMWLVLTLGDKVFNAKVLKEAEAEQIWVNAVDDSENCSVILPARLRQGALMLTVSTSGLSPAFTTWLKRQLEEFADFRELEKFLLVISAVREEIQKTGESTESFNWQSALDLAVKRGALKLVKKGRTEEAKNLIRKCLSSS